MQLGFRRFLCNAAAVLVLASLRPVLAQDFTGFHGRITDPTGSAVPGAILKATEEKRGYVHSATSNEVGDYVLNGVLPGVYTLELEMAQFKKYRNTGVIVYARQPRRVDIRLDLGDVTQTVSVKEEGSRIETDTARISYKQPNREIYALNLGGGGLGIKSASPGSEAWSQAHGNHANNSNSEQDGITNDGYGLFRAPQETVREINYIALNAPAEFRTSTTVSSAGRTGSNDFHAEYFINWAHDRFNSLPAGAIRRPVVQRPSVFHEFIVNGPVAIPKIYNGRNRTFFYFMYQPLKSRTAQNSLSYIAPTARMRNGDFSEWAAATNRTLVDPLSGRPFPGNVIPKERFGPTWNRLLAIGDGLGGVPSPNRPDLFARNYEFTNTSSSDESWFHYRLDHQISQKNTVSVTHLRNNRDQVGNARNVPQDGGVATLSKTRALSVQDTHVFSPRILNEFTFVHNTQSECHPCTFGGQNGAQQLTQQLGVNVGTRTPPQVNGQPHFNMATVGAGVQLDLLGAEIAGIMQMPERVWYVRDSLSVHHGRHFFKTGFELRQHRPDTFVVGGAANVGGDAWGRFRYSGAFTGNDFGDFVLGLPEFTSISTTRPKLEARQWEFGAFLQDDWKIRPNLTITAGLRLQHYGEPYEANGLMYNFDPANLRVVVPDERGIKGIAPGFPFPAVTAKAAGWPERLQNFKNILWEPRIGLAWRPLSKTVIRTGYGVYHVPYASSITYAAGYRGDSAARGADRRGARAGLLSGMEYGPFLVGESYGPNRIVNGQPSFTTQNPFPASPTGTGLQSLYHRPLDVRSKNWAYDQQWNFTIERELPMGLASRVSYVGSKGTHWPYVRDLQTPPPSTTPFTAARRPFAPDKILELFLLDLGGNGTYHGLELEASRQFSGGLYVRAWYDWKKSLNDVLAGRLGDAVGAEIEDPFNRRREKGYQDGFMPHSSRIVAVWDAPFGRGKRFANRGGALNHIAGDWTVAPLLTFSGHQRYDAIFTGRDTANIGRAVGGRADVLSGCDLYAGGTLPGRFWNRGCFALPPNGRYGNASRGILRGPWVWNLDFNVFKTWKLMRRDSGAYLKAEFYSSNLFNHNNTPGPQSLNIADANFGRFLPSGRRTIYFRFRVGF